MSNFGQEIIYAAALRLDKPFQTHFKPVNLCNDGKLTKASCMERGMDDRGYDCSGLVVASICEVIGIDATEWPQAYRHVKQLESLVESDFVPEFGDSILFDTTSPEGNPYRTHIGIYTGKNRVIHANGISGFVEEGRVAGSINVIRLIRATRFLEITF